MPKITPKQEFDSLQDFKTYLRAWAIEEGFSPAILDSDARRVRVGCRTASNCPFRIRCNYDPELKKAKVSTLVAKHTCQDNRDEGKPPPIRGEVTKLRFLLDAVPQLMVIDQSTTTKEIIDKVKEKYGQVISMRQAQKVKSTLLAIASEQLGNHLLSKMREKLGPDATDEELRWGKRMRLDEPLDPQLNEDAEFENDKYQDLTFADEDYEDDEEYDSEQNGDSYVKDTAQRAHYDKVIADVSRFEAVAEEALDQSSPPSAAELRSEAAQLFQQASKKFQEATQLHMQASRLFSQATSLEEQLEER